VRTILVASDAPTVRREVAAVTEGIDVEVVEASSGPALFEMLGEMDEAPDLAVVDMQMGNMGGMAVCLELGLEESYLDVDHIPVLMLLDRRPDVFLARRAGAEGWLVKPLDALRLRRATSALMDGGTYSDDSYQPVPLLVSGGVRGPGGTGSADSTGSAGGAGGA
jgi:CheY-like chemotaxis protein